MPYNIDEFSRTLFAAKRQTNFRPLHANFSVFDLYPLGMSLLHLKLPAGMTPDELFALLLPFNVVGVQMKSVGHCLVLFPGDMYLSLIISLLALSLSLL